MANRLTSLLLTFLLCSVPLAAGATTADVRETGQTTSFAGGDDGALKPGTAWPSSRFVDNANGTVTDMLTGLIWLKNANCVGQQTWSGALGAANALASGQCALTDGSQAGEWRLPSDRELLSLPNYGAASTAVWLDGAGFANVQESFYWSSTTYANYTNLAWLVDLKGGDADTLNKTSSYPAWPVRGGQFGTAAVSVLPAAISFSGASQTVTIANTATGSGRLQVNAIAVTGTDATQFFVSSSGGTCATLVPLVAAGSSCTTTVSFVPASAGVKSATLRVSASDVNNPNVDIPLSGTAYAATASVSGGNGSVSSANPAIAASGTSASFTLLPAAEYAPSSTVTGTCPAGSFAGNTYTTGTITANCTVGFSFVHVTYPLTITFAGTGGGTVVVQPSPPGVNCTGNCSQSFAYGTVVTLAPSPNGSSFFANWVGCPSLAGNQCQVTMTAAQSVTSTFTLITDATVKTTTGYYATIAGGYAAVPDGGEIDLKSGEFTETLTFDRPVSILLKGGRGSDFATVTGVSTIHGALVITNGTLNVDTIAISL